MYTSHVLIGQLTLYKTLREPGTAKRFSDGREAQILLLQTPVQDPGATGMMVG